MRISGEITRNLREWASGDVSAFDRLVPLVLPELRAIARRMSKRDATLGTTALVHEAYLRLAGGESDAGDRGHFLALAARVMRQVLIDQARTRKRMKRGGGAQFTVLTDEDAITDAQVEELLGIEELLTRLEASHARRCRVFEMRFFGGYTVDEIAAVLQVSANTVIRDYSLACAWMRAHLQSGANA